MFHFGTGIPAVKMAAKFEIIFLYSRVVNSPSPDDAVFRSLALAYSKVHKKMHLGVPCPGERETFRDGITNGAQVRMILRRVLNRDLLTLAFFSYT